MKLPYWLTEKRRTNQKPLAPPVPPFPVAVDGVTTEADVARLLHWLQLPPLTTTGGKSSKGWPNADEQVEEPA